MINIQNKKKLITYSALITIIIIIAMLAYNLIDFKTPDEYYNEHPDAVGENDASVFLSIDCEAIKDNMDLLSENLKDSKYLGEDYIILPVTEYILLENDTLFDLLLRVCKYQKIMLDYSNFGSVYIKGINNIYEFDCGPGSGWMFRVNGVFMQSAADLYYLKNEDVIEIKFICDYNF